MRNTVLFLALFAGILFAWEFLPADGFWLSAKWLPEDEILLTGPNYRGLFIYREGEPLDTISLDWKAGYRVAAEREIIAFTGYKDIDGHGCVQIYDLIDRMYWELHCGEDIGPPHIRAGNVVFSNFEQIFTSSPKGEGAQSFPGGAYVVVHCGFGFFFCDREGIAYFYDPLEGRPKPIEIPGGKGYAFSPVSSSDGKYVAFEDIGGAVFLYNPYEKKLTELGRGDRPVFVEEPFGVIMLQLEDDGEEITEGRIVFVRIENSEVISRTDILQDLWGHIITSIDYSPFYGLLMTTLDGRVIVERDLGEVFE